MSLLSGVQISNLIQHLRSGWKIIAKVKRFSPPSTSKTSHEQTPSTGFEDADFNKEQDLKWGTVYSKYIDWLEEQLDQFCKSQGCTVEEVFAKLKECMKGENSTY